MEGDCLANPEDSADDPRIRVRSFRSDRDPKTEGLHFQSTARAFDLLVVRTDDRRP
jgi:hypothetical protein